MVNKGRSRRRRLKPDDRRLEIIEAAEQLLKRRGADVRVEDVVAQAKAAKGTFYAYFESWDDLLETIRRRTIAELETAASPIITLGPGTDWTKILPALALLLIDFITASGGLHDALFHSDFTRKRPMPPETRLAARIASILKAGMAAGAYAKLDPETTGQLISAVIHETADQILAGADRMRSIEALNQLLHRLVFVESQADQGRPS
jgi:AcrR family transcriptional regulator